MPGLTGSGRVSADLMLWVHGVAVCAPAGATMSDRDGTIHLFAAGVADRELDLFTFRQPPAGSIRRKRS